MAVRRTVEDDSTELLKITVLRAGSKAIVVDLDEGATASEAIEEAGFTVKARDEVSINNETVAVDDLDNLEVEDGDRIVLTQKFAGGR